MSPKEKPTEYLLEGQKKADEKMEKVFKTQRGENAGDTPEFKGKKIKTDETGYGVEKAEDERFTKEYIKEKTVGYSKEVPSTGGNAEIVKNIIADLKPSEIDKNGEPNHGAEGTEKVDGVEYKYLRDNFHNPKDRLFISDTAKSDTDANLESTIKSELTRIFPGAYEEVENPKGEALKALKYAKKNIDGSPTYEVTNATGDLIYVYAKNGKLYKPSKIQ